MCFYCCGEIVIDIIIKIIRRNKKKFASNLSALKENGMEFFFFLVSLCEMFNCKHIKRIDAGKKKHI